MYTYVLLYNLHCLHFVPADFTLSAAARAKVEQSQWTITRALCYLLQRSHPRANVVFARCVRVLTESRSLSVIHRELDEAFLMNWASYAEIPQLIIEIASR